MKTSIYVTKTFLFLFYTSIAYLITFVSLTVQVQYKFSVSSSSFVLYFSNHLHSKVVILLYVHI